MENCLVNKEHIDNISHDLKVILEKELQSGNEIYETWVGWPYGSTVICLRYPFKITHENLPHDIDFKELNDIHYWKSEYHDLNSNDLLICKFKN